MLTNSTPYNSRLDDTSRIIATTGKSEAGLLKGLTKLEWHLGQVGPKKFESYLIKYIFHFIKLSNFLCHSSFEKPALDVPNSAKLCSKILFSTLKIDSHHELFHL